MKVPILRSKRLILEPMSLSHLSQEYVNWLNDPEVNFYLDSGGGYTLEKLAEFLRDVENKNILFWAIHLEHNHKHIGNIKIDPVNLKHGLCEYGILLGEKSEWGKGFAKEASLRVIDYCFNTLNFRKMTLGVVEDNVNAVRLYKNIGFIIEGIYKDHRFHNNQYWNTLRMALFNESHTPK
jgi:ribosomal-protein-alanine N-acetyltransferase